MLPFPQLSASLTIFCRSDLAAQIDKWGLRDTGFAYNIVSVFGSQSTGKSKLDVAIDIQHLNSFLNRHIAEQALRYYI